MKSSPSKSLLLALALLACAGGEGLFAQRPGGGSGGGREALFSRLDRNHDGVITVQEFGAAPLVQKNRQMFQQRFLVMDRDGSRTLSRREFMAGPGGGSGQPPRTPPRNPGHSPSSRPGSGQKQPDEDEPVPTDPSLDVLPEDAVPEEPLPELKPASVDDPEPAPTPAPAAGMVDLG
ncbi:MAG: hypothetical protein ACOYOL_03170 [Chthoniobacterales bacterium]